MAEEDAEEGAGALDDAIRAAAGSAGGERVVFAEFARAFLADAGRRAQQTQGADGLVDLARAAWDLARSRPAGEQVVCIRAPEARPARTVIEIQQEDRPFIVDTLRLALRRHGLQEQLLLHPTIPVTRDADGALRAIGGPGAVRESLVTAEVFPHVGGDRAKEVERDLRQVMRWVAHVTEDHHRMVRAIREIGVNVEFAGRHLEGGAERAAKIVRFLDWLIDGHFVLMGVRSYDARKVDDGFEISIRPESGLGMWRDPGESRFREARRGAQIPAGLLSSLADDRVVQISKGWTESRIHREGRIDRIFLKDHDEAGEVSGFHIVSGLFTFRALRTPSSQLPLLSERLEDILSREGAAPESHRHKALVAAFDSAPMEFLYGASLEDNRALIEEIVDAEGAEEPRVVLRTDAGERSFYAAVLLPRDRYSEALRFQIRDLLAGHPDVGYVDGRVSFLEEGTAILHFFCTLRDGHAPDSEALEATIRLLAARWEDQLADALIAAHGETLGGELAARYADAFPTSLQVTTRPVDAVRDVDGLEALHDAGAPQVALFFDGDDRETTALRIYLEEQRLLSDLLPLVDHFGIRVVDARQTRVTTQDRPRAVIHRLRVLPLGGEQADLDAIAPLLGDALRAALQEVAPDDALHGLVLGAGLDWREVDLVRAYLAYFNQIQGTLTRPFVRRVLLENPLAVRLLVRYHRSRLAPGPRDEARRAEEDRVRESFQRYRDRISSLNEDRALGALYELIDATLRTNFFARLSGPHRIAFKLDPGRIHELEPPQPHREIFVHGSSVDGVHLRGGPVARGGLRWSDRHDDFRIEILGLMRTQQLKNGLIVPVGAKGGFVLAPSRLSPRESRAAADAQYRVFVSGLLDLTDNVDAEGRVTGPPGVLRRDGDDAYLVVAADKGTAHLSDTANELALARGFWLGDAFASGGSVGYDHKKYAITARGAWECVKHHFGELGIDPDAAPYTVAGIGDMSGDVFGNGLLLMRRAKLVAAFDHRHVFLDPDPDPEVSWQERKRLFDLPRSSWDEYDREKISPGGGVWPRSTKRIELSEQARACLGIEVAALTGPQLVRAVLAAPVDLLWNGGIGTYVKAAHESHADVGDRANESVRLEAADLRARVVGEGGNLGLTQAARIEASRAGVRLDSDAIHNSGGVDLSDHEVNFKILLAPLVRSGKLSSRERETLLFDVADDACRSVLAHNRAQALTISLDERRSRCDLDPFRWAIELLTEAQRIPPGELDLPDETTLQARRAAGEGLTRPEIAVLLGLAKLHVRLALAADPAALREDLTPLYEAYFPSRLREGYAEALGAHQLRAEVTALAVANRLVDAGGVTAVTSLVAKRGLATPPAALALLSADSLLDGPSEREALLALRAEAGHEAVYRALLELDDAVRNVARYLLAEELADVDTARLTDWHDTLFGLRARVADVLSPAEAQRLTERRDRLLGDGVPDPLATRLAAAPLADRGLNILRVVEACEASPLEAARAYAHLGDATGINWVYQHLSAVRADDVWDRMVLSDLRIELLSLQRELTELALAHRTGSPDEAVDAFVARAAPVIERARALQPGVLQSPTASALAVVTQTLMRLRGVARPG